MSPIRYATYVPSRPLCRRRAHRPRQRGTRDGPVEMVVDQVRHVPAVRDVLHDAAGLTHDDLALRAQHDLEHQSQRLREPRARPLQPRPTMLARTSRSARAPRCAGRAGARSKEPGPA